MGRTPTVGLPLLMKAGDMHYRGVNVGKIISTADDLMEHSYGQVKKPTPPDPEIVPIAVALELAVKKSKKNKKSEAQKSAEVATDAEVATSTSNAEHASDATYSVIIGEGGASGTAVNPNDTLAPVVSDIDVENALKFDE